MSISDITTLRRLGFSPGTSLAYAPVISGGTDGVVNDAIIFERDGSNSGGTIEIRRADRVLARIDLDWLTGEIHERTAPDAP